MIKPIMKSEFFLRLPSEDAGPDDAATGRISWIHSTSMSASAWASPPT